MALDPSDAVMRPFGNAVDLDLDFAQADRPGLVTAVLTHCSEIRDPAFWWSQPVGQRTAALIRLVALTEQREELLMSGRCTAVCGESFEFALPLRALPTGASDDAPMHVHLDGERVLTMRRPTGADLRRWRDARPGSRAEAMRLMLDSLVLSGHADPDDEAALSVSIESMDPLVDFAVSCRCPACGASNEIVIDLESLALKALADRQRAMMLEVHRFASYYGWTEPDVLALPPTRRARYLTLIEDQR